MCTKKKITIANPCTQDWNAMQPNGEGRFCANCAKPVIDFTRMTDPEIIDFLSRQKHTCGRFGKMQLNRLNNSLPQHTSPMFSWKRLSIAAAFLSLGPIFKAEASKANGTEQTSESKKIILRPTDTTDIIVTGKVTDAEDCLPVVGATVRLKGTRKRAVTDVNGNFKIELRRTNAKTLVIEYIGYETLEVIVDRSHPQLPDINLTAKPGELQEVVVGGVQYE